MPQTANNPHIERRRRFQGVVTSDRMQKTVSVSIERHVKHPIFEKYLKRLTVLKAHDEKEEAKAGDLVEIEETRPISKTKRWRVLRVVRKAYRDDGTLAGLTVEAESRARREAKKQTRAQKAAAQPAAGKGEDQEGDDA